MGLLQQSPIPVETDLIAKRYDTQTGRESSSGKVDETWFQWFLSLVGAVDAAPQRLPSKRLQGQSASIAATPMPLVPLTAGLYRISWYARITTPATVSSDLTVTVGWTDGTIPCSASGALINGNTTDTVQPGSALVRLDAVSPITYATVYNSAGATPMAYELDIVVEYVGP